jgi:hypothetical protein
MDGLARIHHGLVHLSTLHRIVIVVNNGAVTNFFDIGSIFVKTVS